MANLYAQGMELWDQLYAHKDPRVDDWFMMSSPLPSVVICIAYFIITKMGPTIMENRKPMELRKVLLVYNFAMVILSTYIFLEMGISGWFGRYTFGCQPVEVNSSPIVMRMANACWWFYISKFIELLDSIFFVMRKKFNQLSFLHVFHHGIMPMSWWFGVRFVPGGFGTFHAFLNSFIHLLMYTYYGVAALGPQYQKYLWWKKYMTKMQIIQFVLVTVHSTQLLVMKECSYPTVFAYWILSYAVIFLVLFANFYIQAYRNKPQEHRKTSVKNGDLTNGSIDKNENSKKKYY